MAQKWWKKGIQFECQQSGKCCVSHGEFGYVYLTKKDRQNMAKVLGLNTAAFTQKYCENQEGYFVLKESGPACVFLENHKCSVYQARPMQCRTWPFWPDTLPAKAWNKDVKKFCPGVGKGKVHSEQTIKKQLEHYQSWDDQLDKEADQ